MTCWIHVDRYVRVCGAHGVDVGCSGIIASCSPKCRITGALSTLSFCRAIARRSSKTPPRRARACSPPPTPWFRRSNSRRRRPCRTCELVDDGLHVGEHIARLELHHDLDAAAHALAVVAELDAGLDAVEHRGRDRDVTVGRVAVAYRADVLVDAEDLLDHQHAAARFARRVGAICGEAMAVGCVELDRGSHAFEPYSRSRAASRAHAVQLAAGRVSL